MPIYHFKILVPAAAAGRIIGKGGTTIAQLQKDAGARVKMSKASEFYPGTTERVCLISGPIEGILQINDFFMENFNSSTSMKILVPNSTAGMIIGKGGSYIKQIKEESGAYVQISQKCTDFSLPERCVTIVGELDNIRKACAMILNKIVEDSLANGAHHHSTSLSTSPFKGEHSRTSSLTAASAAALLTSSTSSSTSSSASNSSPSIAPTFASAQLSSATSFSLPSSPNHHSSSSSSSTNLNHNFQHHSSLDGTSTHHIHRQHSPSTLANAPLATTQANSSIVPPPTIASSSSSSSASSSSSSDLNSAQIIETIKMVLQVSGYGEDAVSEISSAMSTLASYGVLGVGLGLL